MILIRGYCSRFHNQSLHYSFKNYLMVILGLGSICFCSSQLMLSFIRIKQGGSGLSTLKPLEILSLLQSMCCGKPSGLLSRG